MNTSNNSRRTGKALVVIIIILVALGLLVVFLPAIAGKWPGPGIVKGIVEGKVDGEAQVGKVTLRWFGPQTIDNLVINDRAGSQVADLDLDIDTTLLRLATGNMKSNDITLGGKATGEIDENGSVSFAKLIKTADDNQEEKDNESEFDGPPLEGLVPVHVQLLNFSIELREPNREAIIAAIDTATVTAALGQPVNVSLSANVSRGALKGAVSFNLSIEKLLAENGDITPVGAMLQMKMNANDVPLPSVTRLEYINSFSAAAVSSDLTQLVELSANAVSVLSASTLLGNNAIDATPSDDGTSTVSAQIALHQPVDAQLKTHLDASSLSGTINIERLPSDLLRMFVTNVAIDPTRDLGPHVDVQADFGAGEKRDIQLSAVAKRLDVQLNGRVDADTQELDINNLAVMAHVHPELVKGLANINIDQPATVNITGGPIHVPGVERPRSNDSETKPRDLANASGVIQIAIVEAITLSDTDAKTLATIRDFNLNLKSERLGAGATITASAGINDGYLNVEEVISNILNSSGELNSDWRTLNPVGMITLRDLQLTELALWPTDVPDAVKEFAAGALNMEVVTSLDNEKNLAAALDLATDKLSFNAGATRLNDALRIDNATAKATIDPTLVQSLQAEREQPIELLTALPVTVTLLKPVTLPMNESGSYELPDEKAFATVETNQAIALDKIPALIEPLELRDTAINIIAPLKYQPGASYEIIASALWHTRTTDRTVGDAIIEVFYPMKSPDATASASDAKPNIKLSLERLAVRRLERAMGRPEESLAQWLGGAGDLYIDITPDAEMTNYHGSLETRFKQLDGDFEFAYATETGLFEITSGKATTTLTAAALNDALKMTPPDSKAKIVADVEQTRQSWITSDVPATLTINTIRLPVAMFNDEPFDPAQVVLDINTELGAIAMTDTTGTQATIDDVNASINANDLQKPLGVKLTGTVRQPGDANPGAINLDAKIKKLLSAENKLDKSGAVIDLTLDGQMLPLAIVDSLGQYNGLLLAALGMTAEADVTADTFSRNSGHIVAKLTTPNGSMNATVLGRDETLRIKSDKPTTAELSLTPELRDRVLAKIHPIFADIRQTKQPVRATITSAKVPFDGDVSKLDADLEITVGELEFTSGSSLLAVLKLFQQGGRDVIPGRIDPIKAKVRNGVVTYDKFTVAIDKFTMNYSGQIDLNTKKVDLRTELPLEALATSFKELEPYAKDIVVPLRSHGELGAVKTEIAPDFNIAEAAIKAGFKGSLGGGEGGGGLDLGKILDDVLNKNKKKEPDKNSKEDK